MSPAADVPRTLTWVVLAVAAVVAVLHLLLPDGLAHSLTKPVPILLLGVAILVNRPASWTQRLIVGGLGLSAVGDVAIEFSFIAGLASFLLGHVLYVAAFVAGDRRLAPARALLPLGYGLAAFLLLRPHLDAGLTVPVAVYVAVISAMGWRAWVSGGWVGTLGALLFIASDSILAFGRFHPDVPASGLAVMVTYYLGQAGIALAAVLREGPGARRRTT